MTKINLIAITGNKKIDEWMHSCDLFEDFKRLGIVHNITITHKEPLKKINLKKLITNIKKAFEAADEIVTAIFIPGLKTGAYINKDTLVISDGKKFIFLDELLPALGYQGEPCMRVKDLEAKQEK